MSVACCPTQVSTHIDEKGRTSAEIVRGFIQSSIENEESTFVFGRGGARLWASTEAQDLGTATIRSPVGPELELREGALLDSRTRARWYQPTTLELSQATTRAGSTPGIPWQASTLLRKYAGASCSAATGRSAVCRRTMGTARKRARAPMRK